MTAPDPFAPPRRWSLFGSCQGLGLLFLLLILGWCSLVVADETALRYRLTVELMTPRGPRTGSGVIEARFETDFFRDHHRDYAGEAVAVDLPDGRTLFALPSWPGEDDYATRVPVHAIRAIDSYGAAQPPETSEEAFERLRRAGATAELTESRPLLVVFADPDNPRSARRVMPDTIATVLGPGYAIRRITVAPTGDEISRGIEAWLPWLRRRYEAPPRIAPNNFVMPPETVLETRHLTR